MKRFLTLTLLVGGVLAPIAHLQSQSAPVAVVPVEVVINISPQMKDPIAQLQAIKAANQAALEHQIKTLQALDDLQKQADEVKIFSKRS